MNWPDFDINGDLPVGVHKAALTNVIEYFGSGSLQREIVGRRLSRIYQLAQSTGQVA